MVAKLSSYLSCRRNGRNLAKMSFRDVDAVVNTSPARLLCTHKSAPLQPCVSLEHTQRLSHSKKLIPIRAESTRHKKMPTVVGHASKPPQAWRDRSRTSTCCPVSHGTSWHLQSQGPNFVLEQVIDAIVVSSFDTRVCRRAGVNYRVALPPRFVVLISFLRQSRCQEIVRWHTGGNNIVDVDQFLLAFTIGQVSLTRCDYYCCCNSTGTDRQSQPRKAAGGGVHQAAEF